MAKILVFFAFLILTCANCAFKVSPFSELKLKNTVLQNYEESCGASALATLLRLYDLNTSEEDILQKVSSTDMLSFAQLSSIAKEYDFLSAGYSIDIDTFNKLKIPVIAKIDNRENYSHFVVAINHDGDFVSIYDPSFGYYIENKREFFGWWSSDSRGYVLVIIPQDTRQPKQLDLNMPNKNLYLR